jgi:hypothetical protein|tara:strand:+ start:42 stop:254 length:213 start_codon:yes stop_codon:yes gene_type:complete
MKGKQGRPEDISLIVVYSLSKALAISPLEVYKMPASLVIDLLEVHKVMLELEKEEMDNIERKTKSVGNLR